MNVLLMLALSVHVFTADTVQKSSTVAVMTISEWLTKKHVAIVDESPLTIEIKRRDTDSEEIGSTTQMVAPGVAQTTKTIDTTYVTPIKVVLKDKDEQWFTGESKFSPARAAEDAAKKFLQWAADNGMKP